MTRLLSLVAVAVLLVGVVRVLLVPPTDPVSGEADAVLVLGGGIRDERIRRGLEVVAVSEDAVLVLSVPFDDTYLACRDEVVLADGSRRELVCLRPDPATTTGEASTLDDLAVARGWEHVAVVTSTTHVTRAAVIFDACATPVTVHEARVPWTEPRLYWRMVTEVPSLTAALLFDRAACG